MVLLLLPMLPLLVASCSPAIYRPVSAHLQLEEDLADDLKWSMRVNKVLFSGKSSFQEVDLIDVGPFGKV